MEFYQTLEKNFEIIVFQNHKSSLASIPRTNKRRSIEAQFSTLPTILGDFASSENITIGVTFTSIPFSNSKPNTLRRVSFQTRLGICDFVFLSAEEYTRTDKIHDLVEQDLWPRKGTFRVEGFR